jgi:uncharacterized protein (DUF924 family)
MADPEAILDFWLAEAGPDRWYSPTPELDAAIRRRFLRTWRMARSAAFDHWVLQPRPALALLILLDQFPRNMFRDRAEAFASDGRALQLAKRALVFGHDLRIEPPARQFFYLPLMHSEHPADQDRCVRLFALRMPGENLVHARAHRELIRRFGRFPGRNAALGRANTPAEAAFLAAGGYAALVRALA